MISVAKKAALPRETAAGRVRAAACILSAPEVCTNVPIARSGCKSPRRHAGIAGVPDSGKWGGRAAARFLCTFRASAPPRRIS